jgi:hypothetical protein
VHSPADPGFEVQTRTFCVVRPYDDRFRERVFAFLQSLGFDTASPQVVPAGTPDAEAAQHVERLDPMPDLILLPFHQHDDDAGTAVDGLGVAARLSDAVVALHRPILMPVSGFAYASSFQRRMAELSQRRPAVARLIVPMPPTELGSPAVRERIESIARRAR